MTTYKCTLTFDSFTFEADFAQAACPIIAEGKHTGLQVADARHDPWRAAKLIIQWYGRYYWAADEAYRFYVERDDGGIEVFGIDQEDDAQEYAAKINAEVQEGMLYNDMREEEYIESLIEKIEEIEDEAMEDL